MALSEDAKRLLEALQRRNEGSNNQFRADTGLGRQEYDVAKGHLLEAKMAASYRCRGGGLRLVDVGPQAPIDVEGVQRAKQAAEKEAVRDVQEDKREADLYPYVAQWARNMGYGRVAIVGALNRRDVWENPDLLAVDALDLEFLPGQEIEVSSIEVKLVFNVYSIWQAANYRQFSHFVYLACFERPEDIRSRSEGRLYQLAVDLGLGVLALTAAGAGGVGVKCIEIHSPQRQAPRLVELDRLLSDYQKELSVVRAGSVLVTQIGQLAVDPLSEE